MVAVEAVAVGLNTGYKVSFFYLDSSVIVEWFALHQNLI